MIQVCALFTTGKRVLDLQSARSLYLFQKSEEEYVERLDDEDNSELE